WQITTKVKGGFCCVELRETPAFRDPCCAPSLIAILLCHRSIAIPTKTGCGPKNGTDEGAYEQQPSDDIDDPIHPHKVETKLGFYKASTPAGQWGARRCETVAWELATIAASVGCEPATRCAWRRRRWLSVRAARCGGRIAQAWEAPRSSPYAGWWRRYSPASQPPPHGKRGARRHLPSEVQGRWTRLPGTGRQVPQSWR